MIIPKVTREENGEESEFSPVGGMRAVKICLSMVEKKPVRCIISLDKEQEILVSGMEA